MPGLYGITSNANISVYNTIGLYNLSNANIIVGNTSVSNTTGLYQALGNPAILTNAQILFGLLSQAGNVNFSLTNGNTRVEAFTANIGTTAGTYGDANDIPVITVGADGRITSITTIPSTVVNTYSNANVAAYLPHYGGTIDSTQIQDNTQVNIVSEGYVQLQFDPSGTYDAGQLLNGSWFYIATGGAVFESNVTGTDQSIVLHDDGNLSVSNSLVTTNGVFWANGVAYSSGSGSTYSNANVAAYLPINSANVAAPYFLGNGYFLTGIVAGTTYSNANVAAYLPIYTGTIDNSSTIIALHANITAANTNIQTLNANVGAYETWANASLSSVNANVTAANANISTLFTNAAAQATQINSINANVTAANAQIQTLSANVGAYEAYANANLGTATTNITTLFANAAAQAVAINTINANVAAANAAIAVLQTQTYSNANVSAFLPTYAGNLNPGNVVISGNLTVNGTTTSINYNEYVAGLLVANSTTAATSTTTGALQVKGGAGVVGNVVAGAFYSDQHLYANGQPYAGTYSNANVASYLPTDSTIIGINANVTAANASIQTLSANVGAYEAYANSAISTLNANVGAFEVYANATFASSSNVTANINAINANVAAANVHIAALEANVGAYEIYANAQLATINANIGAYEIYANASIASINANVTAANTNIATNLTRLINLEGNVGAYEIYANAQLATINANIGAYETYANARIGTLEANVGAYEIYANAQLATINANIGAFETYSNTRIGTLEANVGAFEIYANANLTSLTNGLASANTAIFIANNNITAANINIADLYTKVYSNANVSGYIANYSGNIGSLTLGGTYTTYTVAYSSANTFVVPTGTVSLQALIVGAGGGGGYDNSATENIDFIGAGGGGAGNVLVVAPSFSIGQSFPITIGVGGSGATYSNVSGHLVPGTDGGNTSAFGYTAIGGGAGGILYSTFYTGNVGAASGGAAIYNATLNGFAQSPLTNGQGGTSDAGASNLVYPKRPGNAGGGGGGAGGNAIGVPDGGGGTGINPIYVGGVYYNNTGGPAFYSSITGANVGYGYGGGSNFNNTGFEYGGNLISGYGYTTPGSGGAAIVGGFSGTGGSGQNGIVIVQYTVYSQTGNLSANIITGNTFITNTGMFWANGVNALYSNTDLAASATISAINANITAANSAIVSINANVAAANAKIATNTTSISTLQANVGAFELYANANFISTSTNLSIVGNITGGNIISNTNMYAQQYYFANGASASYSNTSVNAYLRSYLPTASTLIFGGNLLYAGSDALGINNIGGSKQISMANTTGGFGLPYGTSSQRPSSTGSSTIAGMVRYNSDYTKTELSNDGTNWSNIVVDGSTGAFVSNLITTNGVFWANGTAYSAGGSSSSISNGASNVSIASSNANVLIFANTGIIDAHLTKGAFALPVGGNTARPSSPIGGMIRFNPSIGNPEWYSNANATWYTFSSNVSGGGGGGTYTMTYLAVAGGGGGGGGQTSGGGGGGAGGMIIGNASVTSGTVYTITVGSGGSGVAYTPSSGGGTGGNGGNTTITGSGFSTVNAIGGGGGGGNNGPGPTVAASGGSGGGVPNYNGSGTSPGSGTSGQGNAGGAAGAGSPDYPSGGGGGAGAAGGAPANQTVGGVGGVGLVCTITGASVYYAGGGGGAVYNVGGGSIGAGGNGGGGSGGNGTGGTASTAGTANTGGGGGGNNQNSSSSSAGGSGVVILSVPTANYSGTYTGTVSVSTTGSNTILTFTGSGTYTA